MTDDDFWRDLAPRPDEAMRDPREAARASSAPQLPKRFYERATSAPAAGGGFALLLDGRPARTPAKRPLVAPNEAAGADLAAEWEAQESVIDPARMPLTRLLNSAIDGVADKMDEVAAEIVRYAGSDLVCYRAGEPERLVEAQAAAWDPVLDAARERLGARFVLAQGVMFVEQPLASLDAVAARVSRECDPAALAALHVATTLSGSALIALALAEGVLDADAAWEAAHVDELHQERIWGEDAIARARRDARATEFRTAARLYRQVSGGG